MKIYFNGGKEIYADVDGHTIKTDQPKQAGGSDKYPQPFTTFLASLGTCAGIFVKSFCDQRGLPTGSIYLTQDQQYDPLKKLIGYIDIKIHIPTDFPEKYEQALINTASLCSVKRHLKDDISVQVTTVRH